MSKKRDRYYARGKSDEIYMPPDWVAQINESLQETIGRVMGLSLDDLETIHGVREVVAEELMKLVWRFKVQTRLVHISVIGFQLEDMVSQIRAWEPRWKVSWAGDGQRPHQKLFAVDEEEQARAWAEELRLGGMEEIKVCLT